MSYVTSLSDEQAPDHYGGGTAGGIVTPDMHVLNQPDTFGMQNPIDMNAPQPLRNDNDISSSDPLILNQETHFLPDYGTDFDSLPVYHDDLLPPGVGDLPAEYPNAPISENNGFYCNVNHPVKAENKLDDDINAFLNKTSEKHENKLKRDIDNFVKMNSKAADRRMSEDIKAFLRRCRSPSPIESAKSLFPKNKSYSKPNRSSSRAPSKARASSPFDSKPAARQSRSMVSRTRSVVSRRPSTESRFEKKGPRAVRSKSPPDKKPPALLSRSKSPEDKKPLPLAYLTPEERKQLRGYSSSPEGRKPSPTDYSKVGSKSPCDRRRSSFSPSKSPVDTTTKHREPFNPNIPRQDRLKPKILLRDREAAEKRKDYEKKLETLAKLKPEEIIELEKKIWTKSELLPLYYSRQKSNKAVCEATPKLLALCDKFEEKLIKAPEKIRASKPPYTPPYARKKLRRPCCHHGKHNPSSSSDTSDEDEEEEETAENIMKKKHEHPQSLHKELWFNDPGQMNDGVLCRCSAKAARSGIRHGIYQGETNIPPCDPNTNNLDRLYHYRITLSPPTNFLTKMPTVIEHDDHEYIFEGFSMFTHEPLGELPTCKVIRFNINYAILYIEEDKPENFTIRELDLFQKYIFYELLELVDFSLKPSYAKGETCPLFHFMPRFVRELPENGKEILGMGNVINYLLKSYQLIVPDEEVRRLNNLSTIDWQDEILRYKGMIITYPGAKPSSIRVDQLNRDDQEDIHPEVVHFGIRPPQLSYAGNPEYQKAWRAYVKFRHLIANMPKPSYEDKRKLEKKEQKLLEMRTQSKMKRGVTITVSSQNFYATGIMCDVVQHAMLLPVLVCHLRFHRSLQILEDNINYKFKNRYLLQLAMTHPSFRENFGTNPDHARNSLTNCGIRQPEYGDRRIHYMNTRKRGINTLINIMSRFGKKNETESNISHNERLEFLGDAVVEFITSIHLYHMFPDLEEGGLATYRAALVQNQHLAVLAKVLNLQDFMLYAHGSDLCHELELRHAMANCFEALMGALFLDGGIEIPDKVFGHTFFKSDPQLLDVWVNYPKHPLQEQEPDTDRHWIASFPLLQKLVQFEESIGVEFTHIRLLARAFTDRSVGYTNLTLGSNQRMEFLGDTVLQLIASDYLYRYFPEHHEGHLSLLRSSLVNNRTQSVVCDDLNIPAYALYSNPKAELKTKDRADLLESFLGALYIDKGIAYCRVFCDVCFFPRLQDFIMHQDWNDPKSKLQQCCLTLRTLDGGEPDIPIYKVIECKGPTNSRIYTVAVYFRRQRLAEASGHSIQQAEMNAANSALELSKGLFPQLDHQKRVIAKSMIYNGRAPNQKFNQQQSTRFGQRAGIRGRLSNRGRGGLANNQPRIKRVNKQLGAKAALENKDPAGRGATRGGKTFVGRSDARGRRPLRRLQDRDDSRQSTVKEEEDEFDSTIKSHIMKEKLNRQILKEWEEELAAETEKKDKEKKEKEKQILLKRRQIAKEWEEELAETERKEKIRKKISKIKNLGSKAVQKEATKAERLKKKEEILKLKKKLKLRLKEKKRLKAKQKAQQKLRKILLSAEKLKRRLQMREKIMEWQAYESEVKRKLAEENEKKQRGKAEVERMRMLLKGCAPSSAPDQLKTEEGEATEKFTERKSTDSSLKAEPITKEALLEAKLEVKSEVKLENPNLPRMQSKSNRLESRILEESKKSKSSGPMETNKKSEVSSRDQFRVKPERSSEPDRKENKEDDFLKSVLPTIEEISNLKKMLEEFDTDKMTKKDIEKLKKKLKKQKLGRDVEKAENDKKSVPSKSRRRRTVSSEGSSIERSPSPRHRRLEAEIESSKKRRSKKREKSVSKKQEKSVSKKREKSVSKVREKSISKVREKSVSKIREKPRRSVSPLRKMKLRSPSPVRRKRKSSHSEKSSSSKSKSKIHDDVGMRHRKMRSRSRSREKGRKSVSLSPVRSQKRVRRSRSLSLSLSPPGKRYRTKSRSRSPKFFSHHRSRSRSRSPGDKYRKSKSSRSDRDEYLKQMLNMSQSSTVCPGCIAGTCAMSSSHLVPGPVAPPMHPPPMAYGPPGPPMICPGPPRPGPPCHGPHPGPPRPGPPMYGRFPPPGPMRGPPLIRGPHPRFPPRGPLPPGVAPFQRPPRGPPRPGFRPGFRPRGPPPPGAYYPPPAPGQFPAQPDPNYSGPPNYWA
ncbi:unnamed protein product [Bemisia tabaci]|uniref:Ribonuclease 3 n=1 Tax=Bemisia tabaci TaxID=7038 RepID=A0A9P0A5C4_BEMTA|nr:unnamed protein product [Bemisia tabaci]